MGFPHTHTLYFLARREINLLLGVLSLDLLLKEVFGSLHSLQKSVCLCGVVF